MIQVFRRALVWKGSRRLKKKTELGEVEGS